MAILSIDYGQKRVGVAMSDDTLTFAYKLDPITNFKTKKDLIAKLKNLLIGLKVNGLVVGLPLGLDGKETKISTEVREFISMLKAEVDIEIIEWNEVGSSNFARTNLGILAKKRSVDSESARILLQEYLDHKRSK